MAVELPEPIAAYFAAENGSDPKSLAQCFAEHATVRDEGHTWKGLPAIQEWTAKTHRKYQHILEPLASVTRGGKVDVTVRLTGKFPGSPIEVLFVFSLESDKISSLLIG